MKRAILLLAIIPFLLITCKKEPDIKTVFEIESEVVEYYTTSAEITVRYSYNADLKYIKAYICESIEMTAPQISTAELNGKVFVVKFTDLTANTKYYYQYEYSNGTDVNKTEVKSFRTKDYSQPTVETIEVFDITSSSVKCNVEVKDDGGSAITERGVCWSSHQTPTVNDAHVTSVGNTGHFTCEITNLDEVTTYYVRAYATNDYGICYGDQITFTTEHNIVLPTVSTNGVMFKDTYAVATGTIVSDGYGTISVKGVCWSQSDNPTIDNAHTTIDNGDVGPYQSEIANLLPSTTYYIRAYVTNEAGTGYGEQREFTTFSYIPEGALTGIFTACDKQIVFSQGNLQYQASSNTWRFAEKQYDYIGEPNKYISSYYNGWIDLFGWGTSGYEHGAVCYQPWSISTSSGDYWAYGQSENNLYDQTGKADWGYNPISNGGNSENLWRTLTKDEWDYILNIRYVESGIRFAKAKVNNINGLILLPDNWSASIYDLQNVNDTEANYDSNTIDLASWNYTFEVNGAVFLPLAGYRNYGASYNSNNCCYWTSSSYNSNVYCISTKGVLSNGAYRYSGYSVRLVRNK
ncbi:MAG: hypothetical protein IK004_01760 [Bacteroidales bacterium]|nr:hypothetical protein [Bacteroidales bacterium]